MEKYTLKKTLVLGLIILIVGMALTQTIVGGFSIQKLVIKKLNEKFVENFERIESPAANFTYEPSDIEPGVIVYFNSSSYDSDGYLINWTWDFGDSVIQYGENVTHQYTLNGTYIVNLTVIDNESLNDSIEKTLIVGNLQPSADFTYEPTTIYEGTIVYFNSTSYDPDGYLINWTWNLGDGFIEYGENVTHQYTSSGTYQVLLTVTDNEGLTDSIQKTIIVTSLPLTADFFYVPEFPLVNDDVYFYDNSTGTIVSWWWDFDDGYYSDLQNPIHRYYLEGSYIVTLTVTDDEGASDTTSKPVIVNLQNDPPYPPSAIYPLDDAIDVDLNVTLNWTCSDPDGDPLLYDVYFGNTSPPPKVVEKQTNTTWAPETLQIETTYYWQIVAWDDNNQSTAGPIWSFTTIGPFNNPPSDPFISGPQWIVRGNEYSFTLLSSDSDGDDLRYIVSWGDSTEDDVTEFVTQDIPFTLSHIWDTPSPIMILRMSVTAEDIHGATSNTSIRWLVVSWFNNLPVNLKLNANQYIVMEKTSSQQTINYPLQQESTT